MDSLGGCSGPVQRGGLLLDQAMRCLLELLGVEAGVELWIPMGFMEL